MTIAVLLLIDWLILDSVLRRIGKFQSYNDGLS